MRSIWNICIGLILTLIIAFLVGAIYFYNDAQTTESFKTCMWGFVISFVTLFILAIIEAEEKEEGV